ncbi:NFACT family protein [bacterium]|nr:NFACT family protein [bacterium]
MSIKTTKIDSLILKMFEIENKDFLIGSYLQKVRQPSKSEIILTFRAGGVVKNISINIAPEFNYIAFVQEVSQMPKIAPMFCMLLRKYLQSSRLVDFRVVDYERIIEFHFNSYDEIGSLSPLCLAVELMGKHSNIILYNKKTNLILGCAHNISQEKSSVRELWGGIKYSYPPPQNKIDILNDSFGGFASLIYGLDEPELIANAISKKYFYFTKKNLEEIIIYTGLENVLEEPVILFEVLQKISKMSDLPFIKKIYEMPACVNDFILENFVSKFTNNVFLKKQNKLRRKVEAEIAKRNRVLSAPTSLEKQEKYKLWGDLIFANLYNISHTDEFLIVDDEKIPIDKKIGATATAQKYYKLYQKEKQGAKFKEEFFNIAKSEKEYFEEILFDIDEAETQDELDEIETLFAHDKNNVQLKPKVQEINHNGWRIYIGKNAKQNDYLLSKIARGEDFWFHALNAPSCHLILKQSNDKKMPDKDILEYCARLVKENSKYKNSGKSSIIYTKRKYLKKPTAKQLGLVIYSMETEIVI